MGSLKHLEFCVSKADFSSIQHSREGNGGIQPQGCDRMETPKPSPSTVEGKKGGSSQVDLSQGPVEHGGGS